MVGEPRGQDQVQENIQECWLTLQEEIGQLWQMGMDRGGCQDLVIMGQGGIDESSLDAFVAWEGIAGRLSIQGPSGKWARVLEQLLRKPAVQEGLLEQSLQWSRVLGISADMEWQE